jgi:hypothetical protein
LAVPTRLADPGFGAFGSKSGSKRGNNLIRSRSIQRSANPVNRVQERRHDDVSAAAALAVQDDPLSEEPGCCRANYSHCSVAAVAGEV